MTNKSDSNWLSIAIVIPTYRREQVLLDTIEAVRKIAPATAKLIIVDQTEEHTPHVAETLSGWEAMGIVILEKSEKPSIPRAMNIGLNAAKTDIVLFVDDDIIPEPELIEAHLEAHREGRGTLITGRVIQPWQEAPRPDDKEHGGFASTKSGFVMEFMGGNFSVWRKAALELGGFDENFVRVAYNFEAEFAYRLRNAGHKIYFEPKACIHHLKASSGGTRTFGEHLTTIRGDHAVGTFYFILRTWNGSESLRLLACRPFRAVLTRHHLWRPWWIPITLFAELRGLIWAFWLAAKGPKYMATRSAVD